MNTKKATKRALLTSVMALVMCVVMLVGTTFAWFTDTASTGVNKIQAGNLKVDIIGAGSENHVSMLNFTKAAGPFPRLQHTSQKAKSFFGSRAAAM